MKTNVKAIKTQMTEVGLVTAGFMGANAVTKIAPIKNDKIKAVLPLAIGVATVLATKNKTLQSIGIGTASYGVLKTVRTLLAGSDPTAVSGIADNPAVKKIVDMLIPNLGDAGIGYGGSHANYFEPAIVDVPFEEVNGVGSIAEEALLGFEESSLLGYDYDYENEMYL